MTRFNDLGAAMGAAKHNFPNDQLAVLLCNTAPSPEAKVRADIEEIPFENGYTVNGFPLNFGSSDFTDGKWRLVLGDAFIQPQSGSLTFRYIVICNLSSDEENLIAYGDFGQVTDLGEGIYPGLDSADGVVNW
jgi:hypothetical protein